MSEDVVNKALRAFETKHGNGFTMTPTGMGDTSALNKVEFKPGANNATPKRELTDTEKAEAYKRWLTFKMYQQAPLEGEYSEKLGINADGTLDRKRRVGEEIPPYLTTIDLATTIIRPEDLFDIMQSAVTEYPNLSISFDGDPTGSWIQYSVSKK